MSIKDVLAERGVLAHVILPPAIDLLLSALEPVSPPLVPDANGIIVGDLKLVGDLSKSPIPGFDFVLTLPTDVVDPAPFKLKLEPPLAPTSFKFWLVLAKQGQIYMGFKFIEQIPGLGLTAATIVTAPDGTISLEAIPGSSPMLVSRSDEAGSELGPALLVSGSASEPASIRFSPDTDSTEGVIALGLEPPAVVFGGSQIGFYCPSIILDDSETAKGPGNGALGVDPPKPSIDADAPIWRGLLARQLDFYLPSSVPFFGGHPVKGYFAVPRGDGGLELIIETRIPARPATGTQPSRPGYSIRIECIDPTATGLSALVPTLISASMELPLDGAQAPLGNSGPITFAAGKPVRVTATFARDAVNDGGTMRLAVGLSAQGKDGLLSVTTGPEASTLSPPKLFNTAAATATALIADQNIPQDQAVGDGTGVALSAVAAAGAALSSLFQPESNFVLHGAEIESTGHGLPVGGKVTLAVDYSVAVRVVKLGIPGGALSVEMRKDQPMRIRARRVRISIDPNRSGLQMIALDCSRAKMEIEDPGAWDIEGLKQLFDVVGSRSGRGSAWIEVDLRFKLNLGPIRVSGLTIRATLNAGVPQVTLRGIEAQLLIPGAIDGKGHLHLIDGGFEASLGASIIPLKVTADAGIIYAPPMIVLRLGVDLPAPIPLANSGLGLLGVGGLFGISAEPRYEDGAEADPVLRQLQWEPVDQTSFAPKSGQSTFGIEAAVGTLPDLGFTFSAKAGVLITVPDVAVRGSLNGRVLQPAAKMADPSYPPPWGMSFIGFVGVDSNAVSFAVIGNVDLTPLLEIRVPVAGYYPFTPSDDWYTYLGADGYAGEGRAIGPISAKVLPGILDVGAEAYLMARGKGITAWPHGRSLPGQPITLNDGFVIAFGFALQSTFGFKPIAWAELYASLDLLIGAKPPTLAGFGRAGGSLNLGPFSIGVQAAVTFFAQNDTRYFWAEVTGRIELLFFDIEGTVTISFGTSEEPELPSPDRHPLDLFDANGNRSGSTPVLTDDSYRVLTSLFDTPDQVTDENRVWPDAMISLPFAIAPEIKNPDAGLQFPGILGPGAIPPAKRIGSEMLYYKWRLDALSLVDVTDEADQMNGAGVAPAAQLSSRWQVPRSGSGDVSELLLFSTSGDLWVNRRPDGGKELPHDPIGQNADICNRRRAAEPGWAIGHLASMEAAGFLLPPDPISVDPMLSQVKAHMHHFALSHSWKAFPLDNVFTLPQPFSLRSASIEAFDEPLDIGRKFFGEIVAQNLCWLAGMEIAELIETGPYAAQRIHLDLDEAITDGLLILTCDRRAFSTSERFFGVIVEDAFDGWVRERLFDLRDNKVAAVFRQQSSNAIDRVIVSWPLGKPLGVVGLRGMTVSAVATADAELKATLDLIDILSDAKADGPKIDPMIFGKHQRAILSPDRLYRLDVDMSWSGEMYKQDEKGGRVLIKSLTDQTTYTPKGGGSISTSRKLFFATAKKPAAATVPTSGQSGFATWLYRKQNSFQPEMIERYLAGYEPGQSEEYRFRDDPLRAHFLQDHAAALAKAYGFTISVAVRRTDQPGDEHAEPAILGPVWSFATDPKFLGAVDRIRYADIMTSTCSLPLPGATATVDNLSLDPEAWYELYVLAKSDDPAFADGRLPGVSFRTSRWRSPEFMFAGLGLTVASSAPPQPDSVMIGDLAISSTALPGGAVIEDDDHAFQNALTTLGLEGWPVTITPRLSRMWTANGAGGWLFAGLMIESPEPIHRPGRLALDPQGVQLETSPAAGAVSFGVRRRDRSGSRLLYLTQTPFAVASPPNQTRLVFKGTSWRGGPNSTGVSITGKLTLPHVPAFAEDP